MEKRKRRSIILTGNRITIILKDGDIDIIRTLQARLIKDTKKKWSFSAVVSLILSIGIGSKDFKDMIDTVVGISKREKKK